MTKRHEIRYEDSVDILAKWLCSSDRSQSHTYFYGVSTMKMKLQNDVYNIFCCGKYLAKDLYFFP